MRVVEPIDDTSIVTEVVTIAELKISAERKFGDMVKAVVDIATGIMAIGGELHADEEQVLLDRGSRQGDLWGINLYPDQFPDDDWLEFDSMIKYPSCPRQPVSLGRQSPAPGADPWRGSRLGTTR